MSAVGTVETDARQLIRHDRVSGTDARGGRRPAMDRYAARLTLIEAVLRYREQDEEGALRCLDQLAGCSFLELSECLARDAGVGGGGRWGGSYVMASDGPELTASQREVLRHVAGGASNARIGRRMGVSEDTVKWHLKQAFRRLGVSNRCAAVTAARARGAL
ncbi:two-component system response regulator transcriptional regulator [Salinisphaera sp. PC39]